jgi:long-chain fatty acid transport protein
MTTKISRCFSLLLKMGNDITTATVAPGQNILSSGGLMKTLLLLCLILLPVHAWAGGFLIYNQDAKANGMGLAVASSIDNPSAVFYNPALLPEQKGMGLSAGVNTFISTRTFKDASTGITVNAVPKNHFIPTFFAAYTIDNLSVGLGIYTPFGLSMEWPQTWVGRYQTTYAEITSNYVNPVVAYKFNDYLSLSAGLSYVASSVTLKNSIAVGPTTDAVAKLSGTSTGWGYNAALAVKLPKDVTLSLTYRSAVDLGYSGDVNFYAFPPIKQYLPDGRASTNITLPFIWTAGIAKKFGDLTIEGDIFLTGWSSLGKYTITFKNGMTPLTVYKDWSNSPSFSVGANYRWNKYLETQLGYMYDKTPVPDSTLSPELPDASRNLLTCGATLTLDDFKFGLGYQATFFDKADSTKNTVGAPKGTYNSFANVILFNVSYRH